jgi:RNA polymerase sigma-70 factor, ECF subfamily
MTYRGFVRNVVAPERCVDGGVSVGEREDARLTVISEEAVESTHRTPLRYNFFNPYMAQAAPAGEITRLLGALKRGDAEAESRLMSLVYAEFHARAEHYMRAERRDHTLQPTALVHEAYLRMMQDHAIDFQSRAHFFATASVVMRRVLVDHARAHGAGKRPGGKQKVELNDFLAAQSPRLDQMLILDEALTRLTQMDPRQGRMVEIIYFGGLTHEEAAAVLGISVRTVKRDWNSARAWLQAELDQPRP